MSQNNKELLNAAGVSFYEHLADYPETFQAMPRWVTPHVYAMVRGLVRARLSLEQFKLLDSHYKLQKK